MRNKQYITHLLRSVRDSAGRFFAIFCIVLLGVGFMSGMLSSAPDMRLSLDAYFDQTNRYDIRIVGTLGITQDDILTIKKTDGVRGVMASYTADAIMDSDTGDTKVARITTLPFSLLFSDNESYINQIRLISGRTPEAADEAVLISSPSFDNAYTIGDRLNFSQDNEALDDTFTVEGLTIVGIAESPCHFSIDKQNTDIGSGSVGIDLLVGQDSFCLPYYTDAYVTVSGARELNSFDGSYENRVAEIVEVLSGISGLRCEVRKNEVSDQIKEAKRELTANKKELYTAEGKLSAASSQIKMMEGTIPELEAAVAQGREQYTAGLELYDEQMAEAKDALDAAKSALMQVNMMVAVADEAIASAKEELQTMRDEGNEEAAELLQAQLDYLLEYYDGLMARVDEVNKQYEEGLALYKSAKKEADAKLSEAESMILSYETQLQSAKEQLSQAKKEYDEGLAAFKEQEAIALPQFEDAEKKIADMEKFLEEVSTPEWYVLTREDEVAVSGFADNADRIGAIARVFPVFFFLVAALVALTTMTRMIEEERTQIGTLKALGFSRKAIMAKYILYSEMATVCGSALGIVIGVTLLPRVLWNTYGIMYMLPAMKTPFHPLYCLTAAGAAIVCTFITTWVACRASLAEVPARLMLPKPPKAGKKIFLERMGFIWKHMSFTIKVTARNILRYKKRFFMTVSGIAGCTALLLTGFGLRDSISDIVDKQYTQLHTYHAIAGLRDNKNLQELTAYLEDSGYDYVLARQNTVTVSAGEEELEETLFVCEDKEKLSRFLVLRDRKAQTSVTLTDEGVVLTEKMASNLGVAAGDRITVTDNNVEKELTVLGVTENYVYGYVYMTETLYNNTFGALSDYNVVEIRFDDDAKNSGVATAILQNESVAQLTFTEDLMDTFEQMLDKVNTVVWVLIVAAAMLAFVVLYNLININITERRREIATLKVLGFHDKETYAYIFRETAILTVIGTAIGLVLGIFLWMFVVKTAEVDMVMFGRDIYWWSYVISALLTFLFSGAVFLTMTPKLRNIDMVESLKSGE